MKLIEIFRAGKRHDANGQLVEITTDQLAQTVAHYNPDFHEAPLVIGHPKTNNPAFGWVKKLLLDGDVLKAEVDQLDPDFAEMVKNGKFKKVSAAFYLPDSVANPNQGILSLRHVGFLGAMPPAVKGLAQVEFNDDEQGIIEFSLSETAPTQGEPEMSADELKSLKEEFESLKAELESLKTENQKLKQACDAAELEKQEAEIKAIKQNNAEFAEGLVKDGKLPPVAKTHLLQALDGLVEMKVKLEPEFNEGNDVLGQLKEALSKLPTVIEFSEVASKEMVAEASDNTVEYAEGTDPNSIEVDKTVRAYMKQHGVDYTTAFNAIYH